MIQRIQTIWLLLAFVLTAVCLCLPVAQFAPEGMGVNTVMYNLWVIDGNGVHHYWVSPLFIILLATTPICVMAIIGFRNRKRQARLCLTNTILLIGWMVCYGVYCYRMGWGAFRWEWAACLPLLTLICYALARRAILADEALVRAADRIR